MRNPPYTSRELRTLALGTIFAGIDGHLSPPPWLHRYAADGLGGVVLFGRNIHPDHSDAGVARLTAAIREAGPDLLVAVDEEGGDMTRLDAAYGSPLPGNAALGVLDEPALTEQIAAELAGRLRRCGVDINLAPVADVNTEDANPVIGVRSFGADPELVARHVAAFVTGQQRHGVAATAKHFPGHGATRDDSHLTIPVLDMADEVIRKIQLPPFRAAVEAGAAMVMTAHVLVSALDESGPASLSPPIVTGLLRDELGHRGVVITDGLDMDAMSQTYGHADAAVRALAAGTDALCIGGESTRPELLDHIASAIVDAVGNGQLSAERLVDATTRIAGLREWSRRAAPAPAPEDAAVANGSAASDAARRVVTVQGDVVISEAPLVLELHDAPSPATGDVPWGIGQPLAERMPGTIVVTVREDGPDVGTVLAGHPDREVVVSVRGTHRHGWQRRVVQQVRHRCPGVLVVDHDVSAAPGVLGNRYVRAYGASRATAEAAADVVTGRLA
ncbi:glycoside hydrolase family 3 protein [Phytoactinopolyspora halophila]|nr:glycoside hydrolase family 3 N-terminal domain-containing protein [Phytoactinopolyspora halophila]